MPGRLYLTTPVARIAEWMGADAAGLDVPPRLNIAPGEEVLVCGADRRLVRMRWGMIPVGRVNARGRPVMETIINARSETVFDKSAFEGVQRALVPADGWYEWTGERRRKTAWRLSAMDGAPLAFAAISDLWRGTTGREVAQVATVTCEPNAEVREIHHRMGVLLRPGQFETWLTGSEDEARALCQPFPDGGIRIEEVPDPGG